MFQLRPSFRRTPLLSLHSSFTSSASNISVIIPAYNEAENIEACVTAVLNSTTLPADRVEVWVVDDQSTDDTGAIVQSLQQRLNDSRLKFLAGQSRPVSETWVGKNWACTQASDIATGDFLLFIDADVRLKPGTIEAALETAERDKIDLLTCGPAITCGCLAEWLVQPLMFTVIAIGFKAEEVNDPKSETAFAAGPFMLFRRSAYDRIGGHRAVAAQVVEDVELAKLTKQQGLSLRFLSGVNFLSVRMYRSWSALWEGWTKNLYQASNRDLPRTLLFTALMVLVFGIPWLALAVLLIKAIFSAIQSEPVSLIDWIAIALSVITIGIHYRIRQLIHQGASIPPRYWWLTGVGGFALAAIAIASIIKTETGWGWTWRGRSLKAN